MKNNYFEVLNSENLGQVPSVVDRKGNLYYKLEDIRKVLGIGGEAEEDIRCLEEIGTVLGTNVVMKLEQGVQVLAHKDGSEMEESKYGWYVTEIGLYFLIMQSKTPAALKMSAWLSGEVLPRLREKSCYVMGEEKSN